MLLRRISGFKNVIYDSVASEQAMGPSDNNCSTLDVARPVLIFLMTSRFMCFKFYSFDNTGVCQGSIQCPHVVFALCLTFSSHEWYQCYPKSTDLYIINELTTHKLFKCFNNKNSESLGIDCVPLLKKNIFKPILAEWFSIHFKEGFKQIAVNFHFNKFYLS